MPGRQRRDASAVEQDGSAKRRHQAGKAAQDAGLAAAVGADKSGEAAARNDEIEILDDRAAVIGECNGLACQLFGGFLLIHDHDGVPREDMRKRELPRAR
ncbi:hypothetical protein D3C78_1156410 [compost metagenome]